jgi:hypothetical protein
MESAEVLLLAAARPACQAARDPGRDFPAVDRLPAPGQVISIIRGGRYSSIVTAWGEKRDIQINPDALK